MKLVYFSHPTGNANSRAVLDGLYGQELLSRFFTTVAVYPKTVLGTFSKLPGLNDLARRSYDWRISDKTSTQPFYEMMRLLSSKFNWQGLIQHERGCFSIDQVMQRLDKKIASQILRSKDDTLKAVYAYEDGALNSFLAAEQKGIKKIYDLPIGYWRSARSYLLAEKERWPEWEKTVTGFLDSDQKLIRKDQELELADIIFVASSFTASTLKNHPGSIRKVHVVPYGFPAIHDGVRSYYNGKNRKLKLLYVGGLTQRKGIADVFAAVDCFPGEVELTVVGQKTTHQCKVLNEYLSKHTYIPSLPHSMILSLMRCHDVLLFPSLFEGFGLVISEAMSQGMPVITTDRTAGPDFIVSGKNGWIIQAGNTALLVEAIKNVLDQPLMLEEVGRNAIQTAARRTWGGYSATIAQILTGYLS